MIILGIDPGIGKLGFAVIQKKRNGRMRIKTVDCFQTSKHDEKHDRLLQIFNFVEKLIQKQRPSVFAIEKIFFAKNTKTAMDIAEVRGALLVLAKKHGLTLREFTPLQIKMTITGSGRAQKPEVLKFIQLTLKGQALPTSQDDAIDALAVALCALYHKDFGEIS